MNKIPVATVWLDGCSGCHMSLLDMDERIIELAAKADFVHTPLVDHKEFPEGVEVAVVEGAVGNEADLEKIRKIRARSRILVSLGDCAVTANIPAMRNPLGSKAVLDRAYLENVDLHPQVPEHAPPLLKRARPIHEYVPVDIFVPGCPPSADAIFYVLNELVEGRMPDPSQITRFGS